MTFSRTRLQKLAGILSEARGDPGPSNYEELGQWLEANLNPGDLAMVMMDVKDEDYTKAATQVKNLGYMELRGWSTKDLEEYFRETYGEKSQVSNKPDWVGEFVWDEVDQKMTNAAFGKKDPKEVAIEIIDLLKKWDVPSHRAKEKLKDLPEEYANIAAKKTKSNINTVINMIYKRL